MAWSAPAGRVTRAIEAGSYAFAVASADDDADIRELLRDNALGGWIRLSLEREPSAFAATGLFDRHELLIVRDGHTGRAVALCEYAVRRMYVNGAIERVPYLGALRVGRRFRHRIGVLKHGFAAVRELLHQADEYSTPLTAITADNDVARRVLCAGIDGLPRYAPIGDLVTLAATTRRARIDRHIAPAADSDLPEIAALLQQCAVRRQFAPAWDADDLARLSEFGLPPERFLIARRHDRAVGCIAVWDQRGFKQTIVRGYAPWVQRARPFYNAISPLLRAPTLPRTGAALNQVFLSHCVTPQNDADLIRALLLAGLSAAKTLGADLALLGAAADSPDLARLRRLTNAREYRTALHLVHWPGCTPAPPLTGLVQPEIALL